MKVVAAYLLAVLGGNLSPTVDHIKAILGSVGVEVDDEKIELFLSEVKGRDLAELIACGREKMASIPSGGAAAAAIAVGAPTPAGGDASVAAEEKKEEKKEMDEVSDEDMCFSLFD